MHQEMVWRQAKQAAHLIHQSNFEELVEDIAKQVCRLSFHQAEVQPELHHEIELWKIICLFSLATYMLNIYVCVY